jgi:hypothetical protein
MRNCLLLFLMLALLATGNVFAWSLDARVPTKPVCDQIDPAPAKSTIKPTAAVHEDTTVVVADGASAPAAVTPSSTPPRSGGAMSLSHTRNAPRWQSFLPGMFK